MNEIIGPLYNVFASDTDKQWQSKFFTIYTTYTLFVNSKYV